MSENRAGDRRAGRGTLHLPERRTGFDRRRKGDLLRVLRDQPAILLALLASLNLLSIFDWALTMRALAFGAREANLVVGAFLAASPVSALVFKIGLMLGVSAVIWQSRRYRLVLVTAVAGLGAYACLMLYHVVGLASIGAL
jgi:hypothetical protein